MALPTEFVFEEDGPRYVGTDSAALPWRLGPPGNPAVRGIVILTVRDGRVIVLHTLLASEADTRSRPIHGGGVAAAFGRLESSATE